MLATSFGFYLWRNSKKNSWRNSRTVRGTGFSMNTPTPNIFQMSSKIQKEKTSEKLEILSENMIHFVFRSQYVSNFEQIQKNATITTKQPNHQPTSTSWPKTRLGRRQVDREQHRARGRRGKSRIAIQRCGREDQGGRVTNSRKVEEFCFHSFST